MCRDSALPVGQIFALRPQAGEDDAALLERIARSRRMAVTCSAPGAATLTDIGPATIRNCRSDGGLEYRIVSARKGRFVYFAQGLAAFSTVADLGLRTVVLDRIVAGNVEIASLGPQDDALFARLQADAQDPKTVMAEGYRRNASGNYAEAAEYFDSIADRAIDTTEKLDPVQRAARAHENLVNRALQISNMGEFANADSLFDEASQSPTTDPVQLRLRRNFTTIHLLNQRRNAEALTLIEQPLASAEHTRAGADGDATQIGPALAAEMNSGKSGAQTLSVRQDTALSYDERLALLDAQGLQLRGTLLRLSDRHGEARAVLASALADAVAIRDGRVTSITRLRAQILGEIALTFEAEGNFAEAESLLVQAINLLAGQYPETVAMNGARTRFGAFLVRRGRSEEALGIYRQVIASTVENRNALTGLSNNLGPYFALLADGIPGNPSLTGDLFEATQVLLRPGAADTLETLSRELSAGDGTAARLFRQSVTLSRDIERARISLAQLTAASQNDPTVKPLALAAQSDIAALAALQAGSLAQLAAFPQYRAVSKEVLPLAALQKLLLPGEAYLKLAQVGDALYFVLAEPDRTTGWRAAISASELDSKVAALRETISTELNGVRMTYPFNVELSRELYLKLLGPTADRLKGIDHLIFEPDGAMLQLPISVLVAGQDGLDNYKRRVASGGDDFDFRGIEWLGSRTATSTSLSARTFREARAAAPSKAQRAYIGFGENAPVSAFQRAALVQAGGLVRAGGRPDAGCSWPSSQWARPISAAELRTAAGLFSGSGALMTGAGFTDTAVRARADLADFRILHFATHGLVTSPNSACPTEPALVTSFANDAGSDGLLEFSEIFDLKLDADLVILSACDTATEAGAIATRSAGLRGGGNSALDGLVRAFFGAGGRSVIATHWPASDEFNSTQRIIGALFAASPGTGIARSLQAAQRSLMDEADTSHPFYWAVFSMIGDGAKPLFAVRP